MTYSIYFSSFPEDYTTFKKAIQLSRRLYNFQEGFQEGYTTFKKAVQLSRRLYSFQEGYTRQEKKKHEKNQVNYIFANLRFQNALLVA